MKLNECLHHESCAVRTGCSRVCSHSCKISQISEQIIRGHEIIFEDKSCKSSTQIRLFFKVVKQLSMVIVGVCKYPVDSSSYRAEPLNGVFFDGNTARKVLVAVQKRSSAVECVECVV